MKKKSLYRKIFLITTACIFFLCKNISAQVDIKISILPPYPSKVTDYASRPQQVLILVHNKSNLAQDVQLRGSISGDNSIVLSVNPQYKSPSPIHLAAGEIRNLNGADINQLFDYNQLNFSGISKDAVIRSNGLPEGNYQVCVQAFNYYTNQPLSQTSPMGCSNVFAVSSIEPPYIISPFDEQSISAQTTQNFVITWSTPAGAPPSTQYTVQMVEILDNRNANDAINTATTPPFFQQTINASNLLLYGPSMPSLTPGRRYALMVVAKDPFNSVTFRNGGRSQAISFIYGQPADITGANGTTATNNSNSNIPSVTIKGNINWYYRKSEEVAPITKTTYTPTSPGSRFYAKSVSGNSNLIVGAALSDPSFVAAVKPASMVISGEGSNSAFFKMALLKSVQPTAPIVPSASSQLSKISVTAISVIGGGFNMVSSQSNPASFNDYGSQPHPLSGSIIKLMATDTTKPSSSAQPILVGAAVTDADGNFQLAFVPPATFGSSKGYKYSLSAQNNYFSIPGYSFTIPANTTNFDLGELKALANTYRYIPFALNNGDTEIVHASVKIYRRTDFYNTNPSLKTEGDLTIQNRPTETINGQQYILIDTLSDGYTATRLFYSSGSDDEYKVIVNAPGYSTYNTSLSANTENTNLTYPQTIQQVYKLATMPNTLIGSVSKVLEQNGLKQFIAGAVVTLYLSDDAYNKATHVSNHLILADAGVNVDVLKPASQSSGSSNNKTPNEKVMAVNKNVPTPIVKTNQPSHTGNGNNQFVKSITPSALVNSMNLILVNGQMTTTTDSSGNFSISNIPAKPNCLKIVVKLPGTDATLTDSTHACFNGQGLQRTVNEIFNFKSYAVTGQVVDDKKKPITAGYKWVSGGSESQTDANGYIATFHESGMDTLLIYKLGYDTVRYPLHIPGDLLDTTTQSISSGNNRLVLKIVPLSGKQAQSADPTTNYFASLKATPTYKQSVTQGNAISPAGFGFTSNSKMAATSFSKSVINGNDNPSGAVDLGTIPLTKEIGRMLITVTDNNNSPINHAAIQIDGTDSLENTDNKGNRFIEGPAGRLLLNVSSPGSNLAPQQVAITVSITDTTKITVQLKPGVLVTGTVKSNGSTVSGASIKIDGVDYIQATSKPDGSYSITIPEGDYTLRAAAPNLVSDHHEQTFAIPTATVNFTLTTAPFNISKFAGFNVQIDNIVNEDATHKKLTGSFVSLPGNTVFSLKNGTTIPFSNVEVVIQNNIPVPVNGVVNTDVTELPLKAFNFLPLKLTNNSAAIIVHTTTAAGDAGQIEGLPAIDYGSFVPTGIAPYVDASLKQYLQNQSTSSPVSIPVINSSGQLSATSLSISGSGSQSFNLYGFNVTLDLANSSVKSDGLHLKGSINFNNIPLISNTTLQIQDLSIGTNGYVSNVSVNMNPAPKFQIASWGASLTGLSFNDNGFSVSGNVQVQIPGSQTSEIDFANLTISTDQLYGGSFTIPSTGVDVFGVVKFLAGSTPLSFGKIGSTNVYYIGGSGTIQFPSLFGNMTLQFFQIQTDGKFAATVQTNINEDFFGLANVQITDIGFHTTNGIGVDVNGNFNLTAIPFLKASAGGVHFGTGGSVSVDNIGLSFDMAGIANVSANISFVNQPDKKGFAGDGSITIAGLPGAEIAFSYYKLPNGVSVSASFKANISIPIGAIISINNPGGGFSLNTADHSWLVNINGDAAVTGLGPAVTIHLSVTVTNGPVITGTAALNVLTVNVANAAVVLDVPKSLFTININVHMDLIPKVITSEGSAIFTLSAAKNDSYFMIAAQYQSSLLGIFDEKVHIAAGWGLNVNNHPEYAEYTSFIDPNFLDNGVLKGISLDATSNIDFKLTGDIYIASGSIWYKNNGEVKINMGIAAANYGLDISASWDCGASLSVWGLGQIASVDIGSDAGIHLDYINGCFSAGGDLAAHLSASIGDCDDGCFTGICADWDIPVGGKICVHPGLKISYDCNSGFSFGIDL